MKKIAFVLVALALAISPAMAVKKKTEKAQKTNPNEASLRLVRDALPLVLPTWSLPIFFGMHLDEKLKQ